MERSQFTFYESFFRAISRIRKKQDRADAYDAICAYALTGTAPDLDKLSDAAAIAFDLIKPNLDAGFKKSVNGKNGGSKPKANAKQTPSIVEANAKQGQTASENKKENKKENEKKKEVENECYYPPPPAEGFAAVMSAYLNRVNPSASQSSLDELKAFCETLGPDVCMRAFDIALDEKKAGWSYIRGILRRLSSQGVKCLADWDALETQRTTRKEQPTYQGKVPMGCSGELTDMEKDAIKRLFEEYGDTVNG